MSAGHERVLLGGRVGVDRRVSRARRAPPLAVAIQRDARQPGAKLCIAAEHVESIGHAESRRPAAHRRRRLLAPTGQPAQTMPFTRRANAVDTACETPRRPCSRGSGQ